MKRIKSVFVVPNKHESQYKQMIEKPPHLQRNIPQRWLLENAYNSNKIQKRPNKSLFADANKQTGPQAREKTFPKQTNALTSSEHNDTMLESRGSE